MVTTSQRNERIVIQRATANEDEVGGEELTWADYAVRFARVRFGTAQETRAAAQERGEQTATFEMRRDAELDSISLRDRISYLGSLWDITEVAPLDRYSIRITGARTVE